LFFAEDDIPLVEEFILQAQADSLYPTEGVLMWDAEEDDLRGLTGKVMYLLEPKVELTGAGVKNALKRIGLDPDQPNMPGVSLKLTNKGATRFARVTGNNVGRQLAIILDDKVWSAPNIREKIRGGEASITGSFSDEDARDLAIILRAGALPADVIIIEERTVGPSLGHDSIQMGIRAGIVGSILVVLFMLIYYRLSGIIAIIALVLNVVFLFAVLAGFGATLTLPGIAGIVLTIGMAVDANVLIFERIREELRNQKTVRASIESGYGRAFRTILDANVTTLISAVVLYQFGTGPIKGFAVTLSIGILANMFTAVMVTRMIFDSITSRRKLNTLSI
jgi:protein-export membrane protein SecD